MLKVNTERYTYIETLWESVQIFESYTHVAQDTMFTNHTVILNVCKNVFDTYIYCFKSGFLMLRVFIFLLMKRS